MWDHARGVGLTASGVCLRFQLQGEYHMLCKAMEEDRRAWEAHCARTQEELGSLCKGAVSKVRAALTTADKGRGGASDLQATLQHVLQSSLRGLA